jgi:hypothetical protein
VLLTVLLTESSLKCVKSIKQNISVSSILGSDTLLQFDCQVSEEHAVSVFIVEGFGSKLTEKILWRSCVSCMHAYFKECSQSQPRKEVRRRSSNCVKQNVFSRKVSSQPTKLQSFKISKDRILQYEQIQQRDSENYKMYLLTIRVYIF